MHRHVADLAQQLQPLGFQRNRLVAQKPEVLGRIAGEPAAEHPEGDRRAPGRGRRDDRLAAQGGPGIVYGGRDRGQGVRQREALLVGNEARQILDLDGRERHIRERHGAVARALDPHPTVAIDRHFDRAVGLDQRAQDGQLAFQVPERRHQSISRSALTMTMTTAP